MALISIIENFHPLNDTRLLNRAAELSPALHHKIIEPADGLLPQVLERGQSVCLDFGSHYVGYLTLELSYTGSRPDAPAYLRLRLAENRNELRGDSASYDGWLSRSWIQEEYIHIDALPALITLPRRYAFRYLEITVIDTSPKYRLVVKHAECLSETSADLEKLKPLRSGDAMLDRIYAVSLKTLADCMQDVFEDGPKRDRRLWAGDFRLQALTNYASFRNLELVKRCLYLFAGSRFPDGRISACVFHTPSAGADDTYFFDYALLYVAALEEYLQESDDTEALNDLYDIAMEQVELSLRQCGPDAIVTGQAAKDTFIDWCEGLDKAACAQAVLIYALRYAHKLARRKNDSAKASWLLEQLERLRKAAIETFWDAEQKFFTSGGQISLASQVWMVLAEVMEPETAADLMSRVRQCPERAMVTPYMHHYYVMSLLCAGLKETALEHIKEYWGGMIAAGADTFWEVWDPQAPEASPYGGIIVNSCCHAWSCTPAYILQKEFPELCGKNG